MKTKKKPWGNIIKTFKSLMEKCGLVNKLTDAQPRTTF